MKLITMLISLLEPFAGGDRPIVPMYARFPLSSPKTEHVQVRRGMGICHEAARIWRRHFDDLCNAKPARSSVRREPWITTPRVGALCRFIRLPQSSPQQRREGSTGSGSITIVCSAATLVGARMLSTSVLLWNFCDDTR